MSWGETNSTSGWPGNDDDPSSGGYLSFMRGLQPVRKLQPYDNPLTSEIAIDCEMVEATSDGRRFSVLARVSVVNSNCQPLLDTYVYPSYFVSDYRTAYSGIVPENLFDAPSYYDVRDYISNLVDNRTLIGHDLIQDLRVLGIKNFPRVRLRDTSMCYMSYFGPGAKPSLKRLMSAVLGQTIQEGAHDSLEDAIAAMKLYNHWLLLGRNEEDAVPIQRSRKTNKTKA